MLSGTGLSYLADHADTEWRYDLVKGWSPLRSDPSASPRRLLRAVLRADDATDALSAVERYIYLLGLLDHNETIFYRVLMSDPTD